MSNETFVKLLDEAYEIITRDYKDRMLENTVYVICRRFQEINKSDELEDDEFKQIATHLYREWLTGGKKALEAAIEKREQTEGQNE